MGGFQQRAGGGAPPSNTLWVGNVHPDTQDYELRYVFG